MLRRLTPALLAAVLAVPALAGCGGGSSDGGDPATAMKTAEQKLTSTSGVLLDLSTSDLPDGVQGVKSASGTVTDAPAFDGKLDVVISAGSFSVPVRSVDGKVYAEVPLTFGWSEVKPSDYGAPDPAQLISADNGIPAILAATTGLKKTGQVRGGPDHKEVLTSYSGTVPGDAVAHLIPGASGTFDATYDVTSDGELRQASLTGVFYSGKPSMTYSLMLTDYGTSKDITAP
jgi:lipoprotein LprG